MQTEVMETEVQSDSPLCDGEMQDRIRTAIELNGYLAVKHLLFTVERGVVVVRGRFPSFYLCQVAIECVKRIPGVVRVLNHIEVVPDCVPQPEDVENDGESKPCLRSIVELPGSEDAPPVCHRTTVHAIV